MSTSNITIASGQSTELLAGTYAGPVQPGASPATTSSITIAVATTVPAGVYVQVTTDPGAQALAVFGTAAPAVAPAGTQQPTTTTSAPATTSPPAASPATPSSTVPTSVPVNPNQGPGVSSAPAPAPAPAASTRPNPPSTATPKPSSGFSAADVAGAAVGAGIGVALLAALVGLLFIRSRKKRQSKTIPPDHTYREKPDVASNTPNGKSALRVQEIGTTDVHGWMNSLPQGEDDATIRLWVQNLYSQIEQHVENFYEDKVRRPDQDTVEALSRLDALELPSSKVNLLSNIKRPTNVIKHCSLRQILNSISPDAPSDRSFLPAEFSISNQAPSGYSHRRREIFTQASSQWRVLTAFLRDSEAEDHAYLRERDAKMKSLQSTFERAFQPWAKKSYTAANISSNMKGMLQNAAQVGIDLFAQPSKYTFDWQGTESNRDGVSLVTSPACLKIHDKHGKVLTNPQVMVDKSFGQV